MTLSVNRRLQRTKRFGRDIKKMPISVQKEAFEVSRKLCENIFYPDLNIRELRVFKGNYRVVVLKNYRMIYSFDTDNIYLLRIAHRKDIYRTLEL